MGAISGQLTNIEPSSGATSMMFHATPHMLAFDPHSGDYGLGFFGHALESGAYFVDDAQLGQLCYLCDLDVPTLSPRAASAAAGAAAAADTSTEAAATAAFHDGGVRIVPRDAFAIAVFLEPLGLYMTSECGTFAAVDLPAAATGRRARTPPTATSSSSLIITFAAGAPCPHLRLKLTKTAEARPGSGFKVDGAPLVRGAFQIIPAAGDEETRVTVSYTA